MRLSAPHEVWGPLILSATPFDLALSVLGIYPTDASAYVRMCAKCAKLLQSCPTLCDPIDSSMARKCNSANSQPLAEISQAQLSEQQCQGGGKTEIHLGSTLLLSAIARN